MKIRTYREFGSLNSKLIFDAFQYGAKLSGDTIVDSYEEADAVVIWSILFSGRMAGNKQVWEQATRDKKPIIVLEVGALDRGNTWKMGIGGINNDAQWCEPYEDRTSKLNLKIEPLQTSAEFITICTQRPDSQQWVGMPTIEEWVKEQIEYVDKLEMNLPIVVRPHPRDSITNWSFLEKIRQNRNVYFDTPKLVDGTYDSFNHREIFDRSRIVINSSSGPAIQAALQGIDVITSPSSLAWDVALNNSESIEKEEWLNKLSHTEFTEYEIKGGMPWHHLRKLI